MFDIREELKKLPNSPGVYLMKDDRDNVIYVGKAKNLKNRVRSYFQKNLTSKKVEALVANIRSFEYIMVDSEAESLILESNYIKDLKPKYNILLRDDKEYPFIKLTKEEYPTFEKVRESIADGSTYFGPFPNARAVNVSLKWWEILYDVNTIVRPGDRNSKKYLRYFIYSDAHDEKKSEDYNSNIEKILDFLNGKKSPLIDDMKEIMLGHSKKMEYEEALEIKEAISMMEYLKEEQKVTVPKRDSRDFVAYYRGSEECLFEIFMQREGKIVGKREYLMDTGDEDEKELFYEFLRQYYLGLNILPREIVLEVEPKMKDALLEALKKSAQNRTRLTVPKIGDKKRTIEMVKKNARENFKKHMERLQLANENKQNALIKIAEILGTGEYPSRIESFDISHIQGTEAVGGMVVFKDGIPFRNDYRRFKIKEANPKDDIACMKEVLERRYKRLIEKKQGFQTPPDLILMDGAINQVNAANFILEKMGIYIPVMGMVKDSTHSTDNLYYNGRNYEIKSNRELFKLITEIQNEVHRFAISYHRSLRGKSMTRSKLDGIKGIGPKRKKILLDTFGSISKIRDASLDELKKLPGMNETSARAVKEELADYTV